MANSLTQNLALGKYFQELKAQVFATTCTVSSQKYS